MYAHVHTPACVPYGFDSIRVTEEILPKGTVLGLDPGTVSVDPRAVGKIT